MEVAVVLLVDVLEHLVSPDVFLRDLKKISDYFLIRLPLDRSLWNVALNKLAKLEKELGHIHYYTYISALRFVEDQGLEVKNFYLTKNFAAEENKKTKVSKIMSPVRMATSFISDKLNSLLWGGNSIVMLVKTKK